MTLEEFIIETDRQLFEETQTPYADEEARTFMKQVYARWLDRVRVVAPSILPKLHAYPRPE